MISFYLSLLDTPEEKSMFEQLYRLYRQDMYKMAYGILKNKYDTEDAVHEAFMRVMKNLTKISEIDCPQTHAYLLIIVRNVSLNIIKKRTKTVVVDVETVEITDDFELEEYVISNMEVDRLKNIFEQLSDEYYEVLFLELFMEFNISEIAEQLGLTYDNTKKRIQRAKKKFREIAEEKENVK